MRHFGEFFRDSRGFTLVETVVTSGLIFLVLIIALELSWCVWGFATKGRESFDEITELRSAVMWVSRDLRRAVKVGETAPGRLVLTVSDDNVVSYVLQDGELIRKEKGLHRIVARSMTGAGFSRDDRDGGVLVTAEFAGKKERVRTCVWVYTGS